MEQGNLLRMDNVGIIVRDMDAMLAFFNELGLQTLGRTTVEGEWVDKLIGLDGAVCDIAMLVTPDGHGKLELSCFRQPEAIGDEDAVPVNTPGIRRLMFAVDDLGEMLGRLQGIGAVLVGEVTQFRDMYRLCYLRGPEGIMIALAQELV